MTELILALDVGTTGVRSMVFDTEGVVLARAYKEFESSYPKPSWVEQNAQIWWDTACVTTKQCLKKAGVSAEHICGLSVTNQRETIVPIDDAGNPLRSAIVWQDRRTVPQCDWIRSVMSPADVYSITGLTIDPYFTAPKILWIKENEPEVFSKAWKFLLVHDFMVFKLTGKAITDYSNASRTMLFDIKDAGWSEKMLNAFDIPREKLPNPLQSGTPVGEVTAKAAKDCGLKEGTPVIAGGGDQQCAALGVGVVREGSIKSTTGTGTFLLAYSDTPRFDSEIRVLCSRHVVPGAFVVEASMFTTGSALRWFRDNLGAEECNLAKKRGIDPYEVMSEGAGAIPAGSEGVIHLPHFAGAGAPYWNPHARGVFAGLALGHTRKHLMRSILEGVSYEIRTNLEIMNHIGIPASEVRVTGGAARSQVWMQIQADVLGVPVIRTEMEEATALGAAILACKGVGLFDSMVAAADSMVKPLKPLKPQDENCDVYAEGFARFKQLYASISNIKWSGD